MILCWRQVHAHRVRQPMHSGLRRLEKPTVTMETNIRAILFRAGVTDAQVKVIYGRCNKILVPSVAGGAV